MKIVLVIVTMWGGKLSYSETFPFKTMDECHKAFTHMLELHYTDGKDLSQINGECYWKSAE